MDENTELLMMEKTIELVRIGVTLAIAIILIAELAKAESPSLQQSLSQTITSVLSAQQQPYSHPHYPDNQMY